MTFLGVLNIKCSSLILYVSNMIIPGVIETVGSTQYLHNSGNILVILHDLQMLLWNFSKLK